MDVISDAYGGIVIDGTTLPSTVVEFEKQLCETLLEYQKKSLLWITLPIDKSNCITLLTGHGFVFYDCTETSITLLKKNSADPLVPTATNHTIGVGAFVVDEDNILVVKDSIYKTFKLPGGYVDNSENLSRALMREVYEETGINICLKSIVTLGHFSPCQFGESNIYIVCKADPLSKEIRIHDDREIIEAEWMDVEEYLHCKDVHDYNKKIVETALHNRGLVLDADGFSMGDNIQYEFFF